MLATINSPEQSVFLKRALVVNNSAERIYNKKSQNI